MKAYWIAHVTVTDGSGHNMGVTHRSLVRAG